MENGGRKGTQRMRLRRDESGRRKGTQRMRLWSDGVW